MVVHLGSERYFCFACKAEGGLAELLSKSAVTDQRFL